MDLSVFSAFLFVVAALEWAAARRRRSGLGDYILAGRTLTLPFFVATLVPSFYGGVLGIGEFSWGHGLSNWVVMALPYYVFAALYAFFLAGRVRLKPGMTIPDHIESAYGVNFAIFAALLVFILCSPADEFVMIGALISHFFSLPLKWALALGAAVSLAFMLRGGLRSDVWANAFQFLLLLFGLGAIFPFAWRRIGGLAQLSRALPAGFLTWKGHLSLWEIAGWWIIASWTIVDPVFHQRAAAAGGPAAARRGILLCIPFWMAIDAMTTAAGLYARAALPRLRHPMMAYPLLADKILPSGWRALFFCGVAASILAGLQARSFQSGISLGKDALSRALKRGEEDQERLTQWALLAAAGFGYALALWLPSVVGLWYALGSAVIPALMGPLVSAYYEPLRIDAALAFAASAGAFLISCLCLAAPEFFAHPWPWLNPMFCGFVFAALLWSWGLGKKSLGGGAREAPAARGF